MQAQIRPRLNLPQSRFLALPHKFRAFVAGFGSGKTWVGSSGLMQHAWEFPRVNAGYFAPTYAQIRDIFYPTVEEVAAHWGLTTDIKTSNHEVHLSYGRQYRGTIICRSMEKPAEIVGFKIGKAMIDELDVMKADKATIAWRKIIARMRAKAPNLKNQIDVTTTPEGFRFVYAQFVKAIREKPELAALYGMIQASTFENAKNLPDDYIASLLASYPPQLIAAYLNGQFTNLASGSVYPDFDRTKNHTPAQKRPNETLHVGMDFNRLNMTATVNVVRNDQPLTVEEIVKGRDTPHMAEMIRQRYLDQGHTVVVYPDASGGNSSSKNYAESDLTILQQAGIMVMENPANPSIKDRVNAMNGMILNAKGERRWLINTDACPVLTECLEQQAYAANGDPDKTTGHDHSNDAQGYFIHERFPIDKYDLIAAMK